MLIFGPGYSAGRFADHLRQEGWRVTGIGRQARGPDDPGFDDRDAIERALGGASHILSSVPPDKTGQDPVLARYGAAIAAAPAPWVGYLSSTGVYGDTAGAWVDESAPIGTGRRSARAMADLGWQSLRPALRPSPRIFRLPGIYGPGRSALDRVRAGTAHRIDLPGQMFSRIHVDDIVSALLASLSGPPGVYNIADDHPCSQNCVIDYACGLLGVAPPPLRSIEDARLSPAAAAFYGERRRVANGRARRLLGWTPRHGDYRSGLRACLLAEIPDAGL
ncbi:MAG: SDR family NAD(P)-dependent oxidoreductase [Sphingobium sp.]